MPAVERVRLIRVGNWTFALVEHLDVTAQRNGRNPVFGAAAFTHPPPDLRAEAQRITQHAHAHAPSHPKMAILMDRNQHTNSYDKGGNGHQPVRHGLLEYCATPKLRTDRPHEAWFYPCGSKSRPSANHGAA